MTGYQDPLIAARRLFLLRKLVELSGDANEGVLHLFAQNGGVGHPSRDDTRADLDHLRVQGCIREQWHDGMRLAFITERGEDAAYGRTDVKGVQRSRWDRD